MTRKRKDETQVAERHRECPKCGSSTGLVVYADGAAWCHSCNKYQPDGFGPSDVEVQEARDDRQEKGLIEGSRPPAGIRGLSKETMAAWGVEVGTLGGGDKVIVFNHYQDGGRPLAQKVRTEDKKFMVKGDKNALGLYGKHMWPQRRYDRLVITEGEFDALSVFEAAGGAIPVVSVPNGAQSAAKHIRQDYDFIQRFDSIVLWFDSDEVGQEALEDVAGVLPPGKTLVVRGDLKDANEYLKGGRRRDMIDLINDAAKWSPPGIMSYEDLERAVVDYEKPPSWDYPFIDLNEMTDGIRKGELVMVTAGTGVGKSTFMREIQYHLIGQGRITGAAYLEEGSTRTALGLLGIAADQPLHQDPMLVSKEERKRLFNEVIVNKAYLVNNWGGIDTGRLENIIRYMARAQNVEFFFLDHISMIASADTDHTDERKFIDYLVTRLRILCEELNIGIIAAVHLRRPQSEKGYEDGAKVSLNALRGSGALAQLSDVVVALTRDATGGSRDVLVDVLKNRWSGRTGHAGGLRYYREAGRLLNSGEKPFDD